MPSFTSAPSGYAGAVTSLHVFPLSVERCSFTPQCPLSRQAHQVPVRSSEYAMETGTPSKDKFSTDQLPFANRYAIRPLRVPRRRVGFISLSLNYYPPDKACMM